MAENTETLRLLLDATAEGLKRELRSADAATEKFRRNSEQHFAKVDSAMGRLDKAIGGVGKGLAALGVGLSVGAFAAFVRRTTEAADSLKTAADRIGISAEALQELQYAAKRTDVSVTGLDASLQQFNKRLAEAQQGQGELLKVTAQYNIAVRDAQGRAKSQEEVLNSLSNAMQGAESHQERLRIATQAFGRAGGEMILLLQNGSAALDKHREAAREAGVVLSNAAIGDLADFNDEIDKMSERTSAASSSLVVALLPALKETFKWLVEASDGATMLVERLTAVEDLGLAGLQRRANELKQLISNAESGIGSQVTELFGGGIAKLKADLADVESRIVAIREARAAAPTSGPLGDLPEATKLASDNIVDLNDALANARKGLDVLTTAGSDAHAEFLKLVTVEAAASKAADSFNKANRALIDSGQTKARAASDYVAVLTETAKIQEQTTDTVALDKYISGLTQEYGLAKSKLALGEDEVKVQQELNRLRESGIELSADQEAVIRKTIMATESLNDQWTAQQKSIKDALKAAEDAAADRDTIADDYADTFAALIEEALACPS